MHIRTACHYRRGTNTWGIKVGPLTSTTTLIALDSFFNELKGPIVSSHNIDVLVMVTLTENKELESYKIYTPFEYHYNKVEVLPVQTNGKDKIKEYINSLVVNTKET